MLLFSRATWTRLTFDHLKVKIGLYFVLSESQNIIRPTKQRILGGFDYRADIPQKIYSPAKLIARSRLKSRQDGYGMLMNGGTLSEMGKK